MKQIAVRQFTRLARSVRHHGYNPYDTAAAYGSALARQLERRLAKLDSKRS